MSYYDADTETTTRSAREDLSFGRGAPAELRAVNALSANQLRALIGRWIRGFQIRPITIKTGGGDGQQRHPSINTHYTSLAQSAAGTVQITVPRDCPEGVYQTLSEYVEVPRGGQLKVTAHLVYHRWQWLRDDPARIDAPLLPHNVEMSHLAAAYEGEPIPGLTGRCTQVLESVAETAEMNESRKACARYGLMWRKADGTPISPEETEIYVGSTGCWHGHNSDRFPCYGPQPMLGTPSKRRTKSVTGITPSRTARFEGKKRGGGGSSGGASKAAKVKA
jgi:hypothetical protein